MDELRKEFESIGGIRELLERGYVWFSEEKNNYVGDDVETDSFIDGAWHMFKYLKGIKQ